MKQQRTEPKRRAVVGRTAHLVSNPTNIRYLTGFVGASPREHEAYLLVYRGTKYLMTNSLYAERANALARKTAKLSVLPISRTKPVTAAVTDFAKQYRLTELTVEEHDLTVRDYNAIRNALPRSVKLRDAGYATETDRMIKTPEELTLIRKAARVTDTAFQAILPMIRPGITETAIAAAIGNYFLEHNASPAFAPIVAFGTHTSQPHYIPQSGTKLSKQSLILLDFGAAVNGYASDMTRMLYLGTPPESVVRAYNAVSLAQKNALLYLSGQKQCRGGKADSIARATIRNMGFPPYTHSLGHAVGLDIHEAPRLTVHDDQILKPGMVFSVEPATYIEGKFGIRIEDLVTLTAKGLEILSKTRKDLLTLKR